MLQNQSISEFARQSHLQNTRLMAQQLLLEQQAKRLPCPTACLRRDGTGLTERVRRTAPHAHPLFPRDLSNPPVPTSPRYLPWLRAAESCTPAAARERRWSIPSAVAPARTTQSRAGAHRTDASAEPRDKYSCDSEAFFHRGPGFSKGPNETHHVRNAQGEIVCLLIKREPSTSDKLTK